MKLLLDTHIWIWSHLESARITPAVGSELENTENDLWLSPLSIWESLLLAERQRLFLKPSWEAWVVRAMSTQPLHEASLTNEVVREALEVRLPHRDPVDRLLVATARLYELTLVTADVRLMDVKGLSVLANL